MPDYFSAQNLGEKNLCETDFKVIRVPGLYSKPGGVVGNKVLLNLATDCLQGTGTHEHAR